MGDQQASAGHQTPGLSVGREVIIVALGILVAVVVVVVVLQLRRPSDLECSTQRLEVSNGTRAAVDPACNGR